MPMTRLTLNSNLQANDAKTGGRKKIASLVDQLQDVSDVQREKNNIVNDGVYRIDSKPITAANDAGTVAGDYKVDVQNVTKQKKLSETFGVVFVSADCTNASLQDLKDALNASATDFYTYRVHNAGETPQAAAAAAPPGSGKAGRSTATKKFRK